MGTQNGQVRVNDVTSRAPLCSFQSNSLPVRTVLWLRNGKKVLAGGDDGVLRLFGLDDALEQKATLELSGHGDAVRHVVVWQPRREQQWQDIAMTASYDHTVRVWDIGTRDEDGQDTNDLESRCLAVLVHGEPVEKLLLMPNETDKSSCWLVSAGGTTLKVWNPMTGRCVSTIQTQHSKTISGLVRMARIVNAGANNEASNSSGQSPQRKPDQRRQSQSQERLEWRILTSGLDGLVRVHGWNDGRLKHLHGFKISQPISAIAFDEHSSSSSPYDKLAIGTTGGEVLVRQIAPPVVQKKRGLPRAGTYAYFTRGSNVEAKADDYVVAQAKRRKVKAFELALRQFRYSDALDEALETRQPNAVSMETRD